MHHVGRIVVHIGAEEYDAVHHQAGEYIHLGYVELALLYDGGGDVA